MNISNGHNGAQGHTLPEKHNTGVFAYGLSEDSFGKLTRARNACDMLQLLFSCKMASESIMVWHSNRS
ncbi:TPA: hypothetical protein ACIYHL_003330 [Escherichia coli]